MPKNGRNGVLSRIGNAFTNATLSAAVADAPAITTASGWERDDNGNWTQNINNEGATKLRDNLAVLGATGLGLTGAGLVSSVGIIPSARAAMNVLDYTMPSHWTSKLAAKLALDYNTAQSLGYLADIGIPAIKHSVDFGRDIKDLINSDTIDRKKQISALTDAGKLASDFVIPPLMEGAVGLWRRAKNLRALKNAGSLRNYGNVADNLSNYHLSIGESPSAIDYMKDAKLELVDNLQAADGFYDDFWRIIGLPKNNQTFLTLTPEYTNAVVAHEGTHALLAPGGSSIKEAVSVPGYGYYVPNTANPISGVFDPVVKANGLGAWAASPEEFVAEMAYLRQLTGQNKVYKDLSPFYKRRFDKYMSDRFNISKDEASKIMEALSGKYDFGGHLNRYDTGGIVTHVDKERLRALAERINKTSNADFVKRLRDRNRKVIKNADGTVSTHELGYVTEDNGAVVFPNVQSVGDSLARFPYPQSYERAVEMGDTVHMSVPDAELFTTEYKSVYPGFHKYDGDTEDTGYLSTRYNVVPLGGDYLSYLQSVPEVSGGKIEPAVVTAALPAKFNGSQDAARRYAEGYQRGSYPVTSAINSAGHDIYNTVDTVVGFTPTPAGAITWLGHMGADVANGEYGKVGKDLALAAAMGLGLRAVGKGATFLKNYWDEIGNFGEDTFRAFTDGVPGSVSTNFTYAAPAERAAVEAVPAVAKVVSAPYEIENLGGGYMLKSLMRGNPLEKQISKQGTVNVNNIRALINKGSKVEQAVVDKVLASEEFAGKKAIDYNKFRKAVQDELITYERTPDTRWATYGEEALGFRAGSPTELREINEARTFNDKRQVIDVYGSYEERMELAELTHAFRDGELSEAEYDDAFNRLFSNFAYKRTGGAKSETYTFSSPRIPLGSSKHFNSNTLGHSRTYTTADEPDVLHVMESQSDWSQEGRVSKSAAYVKERMQRHPGTEDEPDSWLSYAKEKIKLREEEVESLKKMIETGISENGEKLEPHAIKQIKEELLPFAEHRLLDTRAHFLGPTPQEEYLSNNYISRQIQENLRFAAEKGQTKMRYPTRETAAKIEGYPKREAYFDAQGNDITTSGQKLFTYGKDVDAEIEALQKERELITQQENWGLSRQNNERIAEINTRLADIVKNLEATPLPGIKKKTVYDYEDILRKYTEFPKQFKKLYKNADVRIVTDSKGNTWYEVDVPENYLKQEWAYKNGGFLHKFDGGGKFMTVSSDYAPLMYTPSPEIHPDVPIPTKYVPQPDNGDYEYPSSTGMLQAYPITTSVTSSPRGFVIADEVPGVAVQAVYNDEADKAAKEERMWRQWYAESAFNNSAKSPAGARGAFQIMPITYKDYLGRGKGKPGDLNNPAYNRKVRDFVLGIIPRDLGAFWSDDSSDEINLAKRYAAYNWGAGSLRNYLRKKQKEGVDIHNSLAWLSGLPKETRDYVNFIVFNQDVPDTSKTQALYEAARKKYNGKSIGGVIEKLSKMYGNDRAAMLSALRKNRY